MALPTPDEPRDAHPGDDVPSDDGPDRTAPVRVDELRRSSDGDDRLPLFVPEDVAELRRGWQIHVARRRLVHERAARVVLRAHYLIGAMAVALASLAGSAMISAVAAGGTGGPAAVLAGCIGTAAAVAAASATFLNLGARAERHTRSAAEYEAILRGFEHRAQVGDDAEPPSWLTEMEAAIIAVDRDAPIPPRRLAEKVEHLATDFVLTAERLGPRER